MLKRLALGLSLALLCHGALADTAQASTAAARTETDAAEDTQDMAAFDRIRKGWREALLPLFEKLRQSSDPRDWMVASQLFQIGDLDPASNGAARAELLKNAAAAAPDDVLIQWVAAMAVPASGGGGCSAPKPLPANLDGLLRLEAANGLAWLPVLQQSYQDKDALGVDAALARMAAADRYDDHRQEYMRMLVKLYAANPQVGARIGADLESTVGKLDEAGQAEVSFGMAMGQTMAVAPSLYLLNKVCDPKQETAPEARRLALCADVGQRLAERGVNASLRRDGESLLELVGQSQGKIQALDRELEFLSWMLDQASDQQRASAIFREEWSRSGDEVDALRATVNALGLPTTPPAMWQPPQESTDAALEEAMKALEQASEDDSAAPEADAE